MLIIKSDRIDKLFLIGDDHSTAGTAHEKGARLGLILCKEFLEKHGGNINVVSQHGSGSTFSFTLPRLSSDKEELAI